MAPFGQSNGQKLQNPKIPTIKISKYPNLRPENEPTIETHLQKLWQIYDNQPTYKKYSKCNSNEECKKKACLK